MTTAVESDTEQELGACLRGLRHARGISVRALAEASGVTIGAVSQIENGRSSPSVSTLKKLLTALGMTLGEFFAPGVREAQPRHVFRAGDLRPIVASKGLCYVGLPAGIEPRALQLMMETYQPGAGTGAAAYTHAGEEGGFVISGAIELEVEGQREIVAAGDAYYFDSTRPHAFRNVGREPARLVSACTPPSF